MKVRKILILSAICCIALCLTSCSDAIEIDDNAYVLRQKVAHIEDDLLPPLLAYIRDHDKKKE